MFKIPTARLLGRFGLLALALTLLVAFSFPAGASAAVRVHAGIQIGSADYDYLTDYGEWVTVPTFGMVWHPYVVADWEPFFHGNWTWTNEGWAWISYEPFGWLVYHYGYWYYQPRMGWFWVPGRIWSPARVVWYTYGDYCAWAPLPPPNYYWRDPWDRHDFNVWVVVNINNFTDEDIGRHRIVEPPRRDIMKRDLWVKRAPNIRQVETVTRRQIPMIKVSKERPDIGRETTGAPSKYYRPRPVERQKMVLPEREMNKVKEYAPKVEREVLTPRKSAPTEQQQAPERKPEVKQKTKVKRR
jgi:hypothetical protein